MASCLAAVDSFEFSRRWGVPWNYKSLCKNTSTYEAHQSHLLTSFFFLKTVVTYKKCFCVTDSESDIFFFCHLEKSSRLTNASLVKQVGNRNWELPQIQWLLVKLNWTIRNRHKSMLFRFKSLGKPFTTQIIKGKKKTFDTIRFVFQTASNIVLNVVVTYCFDSWSFLPGLRHDIELPSFA